MNIFLAILLAGFDANDDEEDESEEPVREQKALKLCHKRNMR